MVAMLVVNIVKIISRIYLKMEFRFQRIEMCLFFIITMAALTSRANQQYPAVLRVIVWQPFEGRTMRKLKGGGVQITKNIYSRKGNLNEKKFMHAN